MLWLWNHYNPRDHIKWSLGRMRTTELEFSDVLRHLWVLGTKRGSSAELEASYLVSRLYSSSLWGEQCRVSDTTRGECTARLRTKASDS